ncbi:hypothetical protein L6270_00525 [Candidatus Parcubacteria bacterium]|nr:hypothetical protein [Patescibacteria group bacterium]MBU4309634.1 hypothetical protein [Patescibacteria group bacterium]MBU4432565.1 hypothetical protein [Patescibacteria group bacterium]MBU4577978.1 hypothetical protein [Patescibacteria group bacterium]MCG2696513.1 hypothetical protein [Candidatus Parcubacteria bacterium]
MKEALQKTVKNIKTALPIVVGVLMLFSLLNPLLEGLYLKIFTGDYFIDPLIGAIAGSISFGIPIASYVAGGELLRTGVSLLAVTAFILTWATVGMVMLPLEISIFGKRFAFVRNSLNFLSSIIIAILTVLTMNILK